MYLRDDYILCKYGIPIHKGSSQFSNELVTTDMN